MKKLAFTGLTIGILTGLLISPANAEIGNTVSHFKQGVFVKDFHFYQADKFTVKSGAHKGKITYLFKGHKKFSMIWLYIDTDGKIIEQTIKVATEKIEDRLYLATFLVESSKGKLAETATQFVINAFQSGENQSRYFSGYKITVAPIAYLGIAWITIEK